MIMSGLKAEVSQGNGQPGRETHQDQRQLPPALHIQLEGQTVAQGSTE